MDEYEWTNAYKVEKYLALNDCRDGYLYHIAARNASVGIFWKKKDGFILLRHMLSHTYLFTEYHWDTGEPFGTVKPLSEIELYGDIPEDFTDSIYEKSTDSQKEAYHRMYKFLEKFE